MAIKRIIFLSSKNPSSHKGWSGIPYHLRNALGNHYEVEVVTLPTFRWVKLLGYYCGKFFYFCFNKKYVFDYGALIALLYGFYAVLVLPRKNGRYKFIFCPAGLTETAMLWTKIPIINYGDCSTLQMFDYYPSLRNISGISKKEIRWVESKAIEKASLMIMSSHWAADFIAKEYKKQCYVIPFGANVPTAESQHKSSKYPTRENTNLLLIGVDWKRKGADYAIEIHSQLIEAGISTKLMIVGMQPPEKKKLPDSISIIPYVDKDTTEGKTLLNSIWQDAHFFVLPTCADCTPVVIAEAFANAIPVLATNTGGISSMVAVSVTGFLFDLSDSKLASDFIIRLIHQSSEYTSLSQRCLSAYHKRFNWSTWACSLKELESKLVS